MVDDLDGGLHDDLAQLGGPEDGLKVEGEAVDLAVGEDLPHGLAGEGLTTALGIRELEAAHQAQHLDVDLGGQLTDEGVALVAVLVEVAGADDHMGLGIGGELVVDLLDDVTAIGQVGVGEHDDVPLGGQQGGTDGTALALVVGVSHHADVGKVHLFHNLIASVLGTVVGEDDLVVLKGGGHIFVQGLGGIGDDTALVVHGDAKGDLFVEYGLGGAHDDFLSVDILFLCQAFS